MLPFPEDVLSWQVLGHQQTQTLEPEQQMWQQDTKPAAPGGPEHSHPEAAPGGGGFERDKWHIKVTAPATASPWGLAQIGRPCLLVVSAPSARFSLCSSAGTLAKCCPPLSCPFLPPRHDSCVPHCSPASSLGLGAAGLSRSEEPPKAAVHEARFGALVTARGARWHPRRSHGSSGRRHLGTRRPSQRRASRPSEPGGGTWALAMHASPGATARDAPGPQQTEFPTPPLCPKEGKRASVP